MWDADVDLRLLKVLPGHNIIRFINHFFKFNGMPQILVGGQADSLNTTNGAVEYNSLYGGYTWIATEQGRQGVVTAPGVLSRLFIRLSGSPGTGYSYRFRVRVNGAYPTDTLDVTISDTSTQGSDLVHSVTVAKGDKVCLECLTSGTPTARAASWNTTFTPTNPNECLLLAGIEDALNKNSTEYNACVGSGRTWSSTENLSYVVVPTSGTIKRLYVSLTAAPGTGAGNAYRFTLRKGSPTPLSDTSLTVTITQPNTSGNDEVHEVSVSPGDLITIKCEPLNSPNATPAANWGFTFVPSTAGEFPIMGGTYDDPAAGTTEYIDPATNFSIWGTETNRWDLIENCVLKKLYVYVVTAISAGSYTFNVRINLANTGITCTISSGNTGNDTVNVYTVTASYSRLTLSYTSAAGTTISDIKWGFVGYIAPAVPAVERPRRIINGRPYKASRIVRTMLQRGS
jgi:hypothetical protein